MKLLFDENLSPRLPGLLRDFFPDAVHVRDVGLARADDAVIWRYAQQRDFAIVSIDADFRHWSFLYGAPPKIIWIRRGNCTTVEIASILEMHYDTIQTFENNVDGTFLELD